MGIITIIILTKTIWKKSGTLLRRKNISSGDFKANTAIKIVMIVSQVLISIFSGFNKTN